MAPEREKNNDGDFEPYPGKRLKCIPCTEHQGFEKHFDRKAKNKHVNSRAHLNALSRREDLVTETAARSPPAVNSLGSTSMLDMLLGRLPGIDSLDDVEMSNDFQDTVEFEMGSDFGAQELLTAGERTRDNVQEACDKLYSRITGISEHTGSDVDSEYASDIDNDCSDNRSETHASDSESEESLPDSENIDWFPYPSKTAFLLDWLDRGPRHRLTSEQLKATIWAMKEAGTPNVPSFYALRKLQGKLKERLVATKKCVSVAGTEFFMNSPVETIRLEWANPQVRKYLHVYPEVTDTISEFWHAKKYVAEIPASQQTPMWADWKNKPYKHFYVNEIAELTTGERIIPLRWVVYRGEEHAEAVFLHEATLGKHELHDPQPKFVPCAQLERNFLDLKIEYPHLCIHDNSVLMAFGLSQDSMPHPVRAIAAGRPAFCVRLMPWSDDVSGNRSKQYNAHMNVYFTSANIPHRVRAQEYFIHFASTSQEASALDQIDAFYKALQAEDDTWHEAWDCQLKQDIIFKVFAHLHAGDNPMQAELASNPGSNSKFWCRSDKSGGTKEARETDEGYQMLYQFPEMDVRRPEETIAVIKDQLRAAALGVQSQVDRLVTETGVKDRIAAVWIPKLIERANQEQVARIDSEETRDQRLRVRMKKKDLKILKDNIKVEIQQDVIRWLFTQPEDRFTKIPLNSPCRFDFRPGDHFNILFGIPGLDPHADTPCEILHTILLGLDKYTWYETSDKWTARKDREFAASLENLSTDGLTLTSFRPKYMLQYKGSLIGRQLKALQQLAIFCLVPDASQVTTARETKLFDLWKAQGELGALLWFPEIQDMNSYLEDLDLAVNNILDCWGAFDPARIQYKLKLHLLTHLRRDILRFGPAVLFSTESFEAWNGIFRSCSVLSNHQSPSRDIAITLAGMEAFKHMASGGWWEENGTHVQAGKGILQCFKENVSFRHWLGLGPDGKLPPGTVVKKPKNAHTSATLSTCITSRSDQNTFYGSLDSSLAMEYVQCSYVVSGADDVCKPYSWVFYQPELTGQFHAGRVIQVLAPSMCPKETTSGVIHLERYSVISDRHPNLGMPILERLDGHDVVPSKSIRFIFNAQCDPRGPRDTSDEGNPHQVHRFVINTHALHNAHLLRAALPRELTRPIAKYNSEDRAKKHIEWAQGLRVSGPAKRQATKEKAAATRLRKKAAALAVAEEG